MEASYEREPYIKSILEVALLTHIGMFIFFCSQQGFASLLDLPFIAVEVGVSLFVYVRLQCGRIRDQVVNNKKSSYCAKYTCLFLNFPGGSITEVLYFLAYSCVVVRVLRFHESNECLLGTCTVQETQQYIALGASIVVWATAEERKYKPSAPYKKVDEIQVVDAKPIDDEPVEVVASIPPLKIPKLNLSGTSGFGFQSRRRPGKLRIV